MNRRETILAVDDEPINRVIMEELLDEQYDLVLAETGEECLHLAAEAKPDLILLDIMMPGIDGYETCRRIRQDVSLRNVKVVLVSAKAMLEERLEGYEAGADDYVTKPFDGDELLAKVRVLLRLRSVEEMDQLKSQFLGLLSHETRTPLTAIMGPAEALGAKTMSDSDRIDFAHMISESARRLADLVDQTTLLCALRTGEASIELEELDVFQLTRDIAETLLPPPDGKLDVTSSGDGTLEADLEKVSDALQTVIAHAYESSGPDGEVRILLEGDASEARISVTYTSSPLTLEQARTMFEDFIVPNVDHHTGDLGLRLAVAAGIVRAHGGDIEARPLLPKGNVMTVRIPRTHEQSIEPTIDALTKGVLS